MQCTARRSDFLCNSSLKRCNLGLTQHSPSAGLQAPKLQRAETDAIQRLHLMADEMQHAAHLAMPAFSDHDSDLGDA